MERLRIQDALGAAHDLAGLLYGLRAVYDEADGKTPREAACDVLIRKAQDLAAALPHMIDEAHHAALYAEMASKATGSTPR